ncbi:type 2 periplasmic-binding domain-containing protein [Paenibacillus roseipurpureus]|uniref:Extracellular solute-binding protein n=1 Tax=Paenibacillus roseopurpureus TaxID=2918901 RepID=A0AA96LKM1_9BACL|nr:extracellular solute-binding protein [Paenibacillus sp. MBLB1832]WNR42811.1 extracellular solute-binding protein [Paenibacillus sp. MBLB1832]
MHTNKQRIMKSTFIVLIAAVTLTACSTSKEATNTTTPAATSNEPVKISIYTNQQGAQAVDPSNPLIQEIEKKTNAKLNITWVPVNTYNEKTKVMLASGDLSDLNLVTNVFDSQVVQMATSGAFWDITPYIKDYKNLSALPAVVWDNAKIKGKNYGIPRPRALEGIWGVHVRKDWLDKLGMKVPETMDEMYAVLKAFTEKDPDGNGKADTIGLTGQVDPDSMGLYGWVEDVFNNNFGYWKLVNNQITIAALEPSERKALEWLKKAYDEKVLTQDFAVIKNSQAREQYMGGKAGALGSALNPQWLYTDAMRKIDPKADSYPLPYLMTPEGNKFAGQDSGNFGMYVIPKTVPQAKMKQILAFMDKALTDDVADLAAYGILDKHYTVKDGFKIATEQAKTENIPDVTNNLLQIFQKYDKYQRAYYNGIPKEFYDRSKKIIDDRSAFSKTNPAYGLISQTNLTSGPDLNKKILDMKIKVIMGKESLAAWDEFVAKTKADPTVQKIVQEMTEAYKNK